MRFSVRLGAEGLRALDEIARRRQVTRSEAARQAIAETAERARRRSGLGAEAAALARDPAYVAEAGEIVGSMEQARGAQTLEQAREYERENRDRKR